MKVSVRRNIELSAEGEEEGVGCSVGRETGAVEVAPGKVHVRRGGGREGGVCERKGGREEGRQKGRQGTYHATVAPETAGVEGEPSRKQPVKKVKIECQNDDLVHR